MPTVEQLITAAPGRSWTGVLAEAGLPAPRPGREASWAPWTLEAAVAAVAVFLDWLNPAEPVSQEAYQQFASVHPGAPWHERLSHFGGLTALLEPARALPAARRVLHPRRRYSSDDPRMAELVDALNAAHTPHLAALVTFGADGEVFTVRAAAAAIGVSENTTDRLVRRLMRIGALERVGEVYTPVRGRNPIGYRAVRSIKRRAPRPAAIPGGAARR